MISETQQNLQLQTLAKSFEALLLTVHQLSDKERSMQQRLKYAHQQVNTLLLPLLLHPLLSPKDEKI